MPIIEDLIALPADKRKRAVTREHPLYDVFAPQWNVLADAYDGTGGFMSGDYLYAFPREDAKKFAERQEQSRYHNYVESLVELFVRYLTRQVDRDTDSDELAEWWDDVDGGGTPIADMIRDVVTQGLGSGHVGVLLDKPDAPDAVGETRATDSSRPFVSLYQPLSIQDWIFDVRDGVHAVKLREAVTPDTFDPKSTGTNPAHNLLLWDVEMWARFDRDGELIGAGEHGLGRVPFEMFRPKRMKRYPFLGKPLVSAQVIRALFNRCSEEDEVLRNQAFSQLVVSLPVDADAEQIRQTQELVAQGGGTQKAMVVPGTATFETPDMATAQAIRENQSFLVRELYRMAHVPFRQDTREVESADAVRLQHQELNEMLRGISADLVSLEEAMARHYFAWQSPNAQAAESAFEAANVRIGYPDEFFTRDLSALLEDWGTAVTFGLGQTAEKAIKKRVVAQVLDDEPDETQEAIEQEIDAGVSQSSPAEQLREAAQARLSQFVEDDAA